MKRNKYLRRPEAGKRGLPMANVRMAQLQLIRNAHTLTEVHVRVHINVCKCMRPAACPPSQYCDIKRNMLVELEANIYDKSRTCKLNTLYCTASPFISSIYAERHDE
ncbi:hypothetical protein EVAR_43518_1 [Eumeta japonica]|uniref:Uncharacterized protein n=1 Tax=Eumeta variegata TaxID=151549 RepID=A0A4C1YL68_EUMVA|nr:hypothetical protein EVAR_43518_1 [Eumeta japonica]